MGVIVNHAEDEPGFVPEVATHGCRGAMSMRRKVILSGIAYFFLLMLAIAATTPAFFRLIYAARIPQIPPSSSFYLPHLQHASISPDGLTIAIATTNGVEIRELQRGTLLERLGKEAVDRVAWSPDGRMIAALDRDSISIWRFEGTEGGVICRVPYPHVDFSWFPDSTRIATVSRDLESLMVWDIQEDLLVRRITGQKGHRICDTVAVSDTTIAVGWWDEQGRKSVVELREAETYDLVRTYAMDVPPPGCYVGRHAVYGMAWSPNGTVLSYLAAVCPGTSHEWYTFYLWPTNAEGKEPYPLAIDTDQDGLWISSYVWSPSGLGLGLVYNMSNSLGFYNLTDHTLRRAGLQGETMSFGSYNHAIGFTPDGARLGVALPLRDVIQIFDVAEMKPVLEFTEYGLGVDSVDLSPDKSVLALLEGRGSVRLLELASGRSTEIFRVEQLFGGGVRFSEAGTELLVWTDQEVAFWAMETGDLSRRWSIPESQEEDLGGAPTTGDPTWKVSQLSPDDSRIAVMRVGGDRRIKTIEIRDSRTGELIAIREMPSIVGDMGNRMGGSVIEWSPDQALIGFTDYRDIFVWNLTGDSITRLGTHTNISSFAFHPELDQLVSTGRNGWTLIWDLRTGKQLARLNQALYGLTYSPDGSMILGDSGVFNSTSLKPVYRLANVDTSMGMAWDHKGQTVVTLTPFYGPISIYDLPEAI